MFESDDIDLDQVLSQFDFPGLDTVKQNKTENLNTSQFLDKTQPVGVKPGSRNTTEAVSALTKSLSPIRSLDINKASNRDCKENDQESKSSITVLSKNTKRKIIHSYFDHQSKRKFPGPAGLLTGDLEQPKDESICQVELLSQDMDFTQHNVRRDIFDSPLWSRLQSDTKSLNLDIDNIKTIKQQALSGNLRRMKAQNVTAFVEAIDNSTIGTLIILRDATGSIKCTLHRDAWSTFSSYLISESCAVLLQKPTVLTTGGAFKKHYLTITLSNILAIYSSTVLNDDGNKTLPDGYSIVYNEEFTVIKAEKCSDSLETSLEQSHGAEEFMDDFDSFFSDDIF